jgi:hypothetical protein
MYILDRIKSGMTYDEFVKCEMEEKLEQIKINESSDPMDTYIHLNYKRSLRVMKQFIPTDEMQKIIKQIQGELWWMVLTEAWCGDSAQSLPVIAKLASLNKNIRLRILLRDKNPDIMDRYLTNGSRSIPKLVVFDPNGKELFVWGPRPQSAYKLFQSEKEKGTPKPQIYEMMHKWYAKNRGMEIGEEIVKLIKKQTMVFSKS